MDKDKLKELLEKVRDGRLNIDEAILSLKVLPYEDMGFAMVDNHRALRQAYPEVIFCQGKTIDQIIKIMESLSKNHSVILATRAEKDVFEAVKKVRDDAAYNEPGRVITIGKTDTLEKKGNILIVTAGTSDIPVAEEAAVTAEALGNKVIKLFDAGVAGIHRLFSNIDVIYQAKVIIVIAGMEGALPSIIGGLVDKPVIAVPTSVGYGTSFNGLSALLTMLNSCASGIAVMNIDNGFGAAYFASSNSI